MSTHACTIIWNAVTNTKSPTQETTHTPSCTRASTPTRVRNQPSRQLLKQPNSRLHTATHVRVQLSAAMHAQCHPSRAYRCAALQEGTHAPGDARNTHRYAPSLAHATSTAPLRDQTHTYQHRARSQHPHLLVSSTDGRDKATINMHAHIGIRTRIGLHAQNLGLPARRTCSAN
jgi:hypothetical protein